MTMRLTHPTDGTVIELGDGPQADQYVAMGWLTEGSSGVPPQQPVPALTDADGLTRGQRAARTRAENKARKEREARETSGAEADSEGGQS